MIDKIVQRYYFLRYFILGVRIFKFYPVNCFIFFCFFSSKIGSLRLVKISPCIFM